MLYIQFWTPYDGRRNRLKHVVHFAEINKLCIVASFWLYLKILLRCTDPWTSRTLIILELPSLDGWFQTLYPSANLVFRRRQNIPTFPRNKILRYFLNSWRELYVCDSMYLLTGMNFSTNWCNFISCQKGKLFDCKPHTWIWYVHGDTFRFILGEIEGNVINVNRYV